MKYPRWLLSAGFGAAVLAGLTLSSCVFAVTVGMVARRLPAVGVIGKLAGTPGLDLGAMVGVVLVAGVGGGVAGAAHRLAGRLLGLRVVGVYLHGIVLVEVYLFAIMGSLMTLKWLGVEWPDGPGHGDHSSLWRDAPGFAILGVVGGVVWGWLSRHEAPPDG